jgi:hypothetical protein
MAASPALARLLRDDMVSTYGAALPSALACLQDDFEADPHRHHAHAFEAIAATLPLDSVGYEP